MDYYCADYQKCNHRLLASREYRRPHLRFEFLLTKNLSSKHISSKLYFSTSVRRKNGEEGSTAS